MNQERHKAGAHEAVITKHDDGSQDVKINVTRLDIKDRTPEDTIAEEKIIDTLKSVKVGVIILCKATGDNTYFVSPLTEVRSRSEQVVERFFEKADSKTVKAINSYCELMKCETKKAFSVIEVAVGEHPPKVSTL